MPFGLCNVPATQKRFERLMEQKLFSKICLVYLDDVIFSKNFEGMIENLKKVSSIANLKLNPKKCVSFG